MRIFDTIIGVEKESRDEILSMVLTVLLILVMAPKSLQGGAGYEVTFMIPNSAPTVQKGSLQPSWLQNK